MKACGRCSLCCKVMAIVELAKPPGQWCVHASPGNGCAIHGEHPPSCRAFACLWLLEDGLPEEFRPDRTKVVLFAHGDPQPRLVAHCDPGAPLAWAKEPIYSLLKTRARETWGSGSVVVAKAGLRLWLIAPNADMDLGEVEDGSPILVDQPVAGGDIKVTVRPARPAA